MDSFSYELESDEAISQVVAIIVKTHHEVDAYNFLL
jgi:hypothetical protein